MATRYERYFPDTFPTADSIRLDIWSAQTFTIGNTGSNEKHLIYSIILKMGRMGAASHDFTFDITTTSGGQPTSTILTTLTVPTSEFAVPGPVSYEFIFTGEEAILYPSTQYAMVFHQLGGGPGEYTKIFLKSAGTYTGGGYLFSTDAGQSWSSLNYDAWFDEYGLLPPETEWETHLTFGTKIRPHVNKLGSYYRKKVIREYERSQL